MAVWKQLYYKWYIFLCNENNQCHMTWGGLSAVFKQGFCAKLELPSSKNYETEEINVLPKFIFLAPLSGDSSTSATLSSDFTFQP